MASISNQSSSPHLKSDEKFFYFAYGSNMDQAQMDARGRDKPSQMFLNDLWPKSWGADAVAPATAIGVAELANYQLNFNKINRHVEGACFASISPKEGASVEGVLYQLDEKFMAVLDFCEGVAWQQYTREQVQVAMKTKERAEEAFSAFVYIAHPQASTAGDIPGKPTKAYLNTLLRGAQQFGLSERSQEKLRAWPTID